ncbi:MAG TPA: hypothetical protein DCQ64_11885 [Candidatus Rokubacteria bacterium]|nr:hypothetical protein [Candidatus Rokubacteria bacterium]
MTVAPKPEPHLALIEPEELANIEIAAELEGPEGLPDAQEVQDEATIERYLRAVRHYRQEAQRVKDAAQAERERVAAWEERHLKIAQRPLEYLEMVLRHFSSATGRARRTSPNGTLSWRRQPERVEIADPEAFCADPENAGFVRVRKEPDKAKIKAQVKATGDLPEGVELVRDEDKFLIDVE